MTILVNHCHDCEFKQFRDRGITVVALAVTITCGRVVHKLA